MGRTPTRQWPAGGLLPPGVHPAACSKRLGAVPPRGDLRLPVSERLVDAKGVRRGSPSSRRRTGHDGGVAHVGPEAVSTLASALSRSGRCPPGRWDLEDGEGDLSVPGTRAVTVLPRHPRQTLRRRVKAGDLHRLTGPGEIDRVLSALMRQDWVVYTRHCLNHTDAVIEYLACYSHRIAITNARILSVYAAGVQLCYKDNRTDRHRMLQLNGKEFVRRYLLHILPKGFMRIRHYGFLAACCRATKLARIREALVQPEHPMVPTTEAHGEEEACPTCPLCGAAGLQWMAELIPQADWARRRRR